MSTQPKPILPPDLSIDDRHNWNFESVLKSADASEPDACCWWEYAREAAVLRELQTRLATLKEQICVAAINRDRAALVEARKTFSQILSKLRNGGRYLAPFAEEFQNPLKKQCFPRPWQALTADHRKRLMALLPKPSADVVPYHHKPDGELTESQAFWAVYHPKRGRPSQGVDPQTALDGLAIMRLMLHYAPKDLNRENTRFPAWQRGRGRQMQNRRDTKKRFQTMFEWSKEVLPLSWRPPKTNRR